MPDRSIETMPMAERGFTYLGLLFAVAAFGLGLASVSAVWHTANKRAKEQELLFVGQQFRDAILRYHASGGRFPMQLEDMLQDNRYPDIRRYLRRVYRDPMTGKKEWGLFKGLDGAILGVYSLAEGRPLKTAGFAPAEEAFALAESYADWKFVAIPPAPAAVALPGKPAAPIAPGQVLDADLQRDLAQACALARAADLRECQRLSTGPAERAACLRAAEEEARACADSLPAN